MTNVNRTGSWISTPCQGSPGRKSPAAPSMTPGVCAKSSERGFDVLVRRPERQVDGGRIESPAALVRISQARLFERFDGRFEVSKMRLVQRIQIEKLRRVGRRIMEPSHEYRVVDRSSIPHSILMQRWIVSPIPPKKMTGRLETWPTASHVMEGRWNPSPFDCSCLNLPYNPTDNSVPKLIRTRSGF